MKTTKKKTKAGRMHPRTKEIHDEIVAEIGPGYPRASRLAAGVIAWVEAEPTLEGLAECRRWLRALGLVPAKGKA